MAGRNRLRIPTTVYRYAIYSHPGWNESTSGSSRNAFWEVRKKRIVALLHFYTIGDRFRREHYHVASDHIDARAPYSLAVGIRVL